MPLVKCPDCGKDVSSSAPNCLGCGRPMAAFSSKAVQTQRKGRKYEAGGFVLILIGIFVCFASAGIGALMIFAGFGLFIAGRFM
ncbi:MAG: hypothetical protein NUV74_07585 [Candidatus Brocadiaceae bacterium]|nr:hypothetical protein [Candidatus Brocadiaceae bacterium]